MMNQNNERNSEVLNVIFTLALCTAWHIHTHTIHVHSKNAQEVLWKCKILWCCLNLFRIVVVDGCSFTRTCRQNDDYDERCVVAARNDGLLLLRWKNVRLLCGKVKCRRLAVSIIKNIVHKGNFCRRVKLKLRIF